MVKNFENNFVFLKNYFLIFLFLMKYNQEQIVMDNNSNSNNRGEQSTSQFPRNYCF